jgi:hypothetical protein
LDLLLPRINGGKDNKNLSTAVGFEKKQAVGKLKTKPQMPRCQWQQYSNKKGGRGRLKVVCFLLWGRSLI